jgi:hypothetical protein
MSLATLSFGLHELWDYGPAVFGGSWYLALISYSPRRASRVVLVMCLIAGGLLSGVLTYFSFRLPLVAQFFYDGFMWGLALWALLFWLTVPAQRYKPPYNNLNQLFLEAVADGQLHVNSPATSFLLAVVYTITRSIIYYLL